ncbi:MAG: hypothetical protein D6824_08495, partial [Planctomycetota bacterium]
MFAWSEGCVMPQEEQSTTPTDPSLAQREEPASAPQTPSDAAAETAAVKDACCETAQAADAPEAAAKTLETSASAASAPHADAPPAAASTAHDHGAQPPAASPARAQEAAASAPRPDSSGAQQLDDATATEAKAAMERAVAAAPQSASTEKPEKLQPPGAGPGASQRSDVVAPKPIRGPRVIEGGREHRRGLVVSVGPEDIFIEFGPKELGVAQRSQWKEDELPKPGEEIEVVVERFNPNEMLYICLKPGAVQRAEWELLQKGQVVEAV